ncbi:glycosyltransferase [Nocardioides sp.]|uniref:glycosyltransferase family 2 protein n=1 Tax=Nocardioides sp. TaxID=35761 RepID=UPI002735A062|nr:glycosyltransferase [Nocardioides sp.]MDP3890039.1 glycosyltransferase [Nocardioides sp.]
MSTREGIVFVLLLTGAIYLTARYALWWFDTDNLPGNQVPGPAWLTTVAVYAPFIALTVLEALRVLQMAVLWVFASVMRTPQTMPVPIGSRVAVLTTIVPSSEPVSILEETIPAMLAIRHPEPFDVWILDEGDDPEVRALCAKYGVHHFSRRGIDRYNQPSGPFKARTKAGNHNAWRDQHASEYDVVAQMDPDHVPEPDFLELTLGYFTDPDVAYVIAPQVYYRNAHTSVIARGADEANFGFSAITQRGANTLGMPIFIGSNHLARSAALDSVGGYASHIVEDHLTGMQMLATENPATGRRWKGVYADSVISQGEGPTRWSSYLSQQLRWAYGLISIVQAHSPRLLSRMRPRQAFGFVLIQSYYISVAIILALGVTLTALHLLLGINAVSVPFNQWFGHWFPQLSISIVLWYWLQRFYLRETDRGWGLSAILVGIGAMATYTQALLLAVLRRPLAYVITPKGEVGVREPLRLFRWHIALLLSSAVPLAYAFATSSGVWTIRFWATLVTLYMLLVIGTGVLMPGALARPAYSHRLIGALNRYPVRVAVPTMAMVAGLLLAPFLPSVSLHGGPVSPPSAGPSSGIDADAQTPRADAFPRVQADYLRSESVGLGAFEQDSQLDVDGVIRHEFVDFRPDSVDRIAAAVGAAAAQDKVALISWEPQVAGNPEASRQVLGAVAEGVWDQYVVDVARTLRDTDQPVLLRFAHEMDHRKARTHPWANQDPATFITAWRRIHRLFDREGATNVQFAWTPVRYFVGEEFRSDRWYPGPRWVDLVGFTSYSYWGWEEWDPKRERTQAVRSPEQLVLPRYRAIVEHGKPVILPEFGIDLRPGQEQREVGWLQDFVAMVDREMPELVAVVYFHAPHDFRGEVIDWRLLPWQQEALAAAVQQSSRFELRQ